MGLWTTITGRDKPSRPQLDSLFALPGVAITLQTAMDIVPTGVGGVCYRRAEGPAFVEAEARLVEFLDSDEGPDVERIDDGFGFTWLIVRTEGDAVAETGSLVTDLHAVNTALQDDGFARGLLASVVAFRTSTGAPLGLVYRYTTGTFYPFAPIAGKRERDVLVEMQVKTQLLREMPVEADPAKWMPLWDCPVL